MRLTQNLKSQENQDIIRLTLFHQNSRREEMMFICVLEYRMDVLFIVDGGGFYNGKAFNESCQGMKDHESIPNFKVREGWCINFRG